MDARQARFVQEYLIDRNGAAAAVRAGYAKPAARQQAYDLLTRPDIANAVARGEAELAAAAKVTRDEVLRGLQEAIDLARLTADPMAMISGWREVGKMCGFYAPERKVVQFSADAWAQQEALTHMTDAELADLIVAGAEQPAQR